MSFLYWIITFAGVAMCVAGAYVLGKNRRIGNLESMLAETSVKLRRAEEALNLQVLESDLSGNIQVAGETTVESAGEHGGFTEQVESETRIVQVDARALMEEADRKGDGGRGKVVFSSQAEIEGIEAHEMEKIPMTGFEDYLDPNGRISAQSSEELVLLSRQVDTLTDDLGRVHKQLKEEKSARRELEADSAQRCRRIAELEGLIEKQRLELKRREERIKNLLTEVGVSLDSDEVVEETLDALASIDVTRKTPLVDLVELDEINDNPVVDFSGGKSVGLKGRGKEENRSGPPFLKRNGS